MKKTLITSITTFMLSLTALAQYPTAKYKLETNSKIKEKCKFGSKTKSSKLKLNIDPTKAEAGFEALFIRGRICTKSFGGQKINTAFFLAPEVLDYDQMLKLKIGETKTISKIPTVYDEDPSEFVDLKIKRIDDKKASLSGNQLSLANFQLKWFDHFSGDHVYETIEVSLADPKILSEIIPGFELDPRPWYKLNIEKKVRFAGTFIITGNLTRVVIEED